MELEAQVAQLEERAAAAQKALQIATRKPSGDAPALPEGFSPPITSRVEITRPSRGADTDGDGADDAVRIYLETYDQRSRFVQTMATAKVTIAAVPAGEPAVTLATKQFDVSAFDASYRTGFGGSHYTLLVPLTQAVPQGIDKLTVTVELTDLVRGAAHEAQEIVNVSRPVASQAASERRPAGE